MPVLKGLIGLAPRLLHMKYKAAAMTSKNSTPRPIATNTHTFREGFSKSAWDWAVLAGPFSYCELESEGTEGGGRDLVFTFGTAGKDPLLLKVVSELT